MNVSAALLISALAVGGDPCATGCECEKPSLLAKVRAKLCQPSCVPCGTPLFAGFSGGCQDNSCDRPGLFDKLKAKMKAHKTSDCAAETCAPACAPAPAPACAPACDNSCQKPSLLDRIKARLHSRKNKSCEVACPAPTTECCAAAPAVAAPVAAPAAKEAPKAMPKPPEAPKPMEKPKTSANLVNGFAVPELQIAN